jgi:hypothetical protein
MQRKIKRIATKTKPTPKRMGRPPTRHGVYDPPRVIGRVSDEDWELIKAGAAIHRNNTGESYTEWAVAILLKEAKKLLTSGKSQIK